ncbi:MAG: nucleoside hydrolase [Pseudomonadota bacterium]|nr:nucleoside hydrolase [Pseudomonadota bacterium]
MTLYRHHLLIDTDPGVDDALAILIAFAQPDVRVIALTIAAGNVGLTHTIRNALKLLQVIGAETPVFAGAGAPLVQPADDAAFVHGLDGFGDIGYTDSARVAQSEHAALAMIRLSHQHPNELTFVMLGPLTNLALAISLDPALPSRVKRLVIMGGAVTGRGNVARIPVEFNTGFDPEAAHIVFSRWPSFDLVDWEATLAHGIPFAESEQWLQAATDSARFYQAISRKTRDWMRRTRNAEVWAAADALAIAATVAPDGVLEWALRPVAVELDGALTRGATVVDWWQRGEAPAQARIMLRYDRDRFGQLIRSGLGIATP